MKLAELEADRTAMEKQAENDADVSAERVRATGQRITELQGVTTAVFTLVPGLLPSLIRPVQ